MDTKEINEPALEAHVDRVIKGNSKIFALLAFIFILGEIIYTVLPIGYVNLYIDSQTFINIFSERFAWFAAYFFVLAVPLVIGEIYLYGKYKRSILSKQPRQINKKIRTIVSLFLRIYFSFIGFLILFYILIFAGQPSEGYLESVLITYALFYAPPLLVVYTTIRFALFHILAIKRNHLIGVPVGYINVIFNKKTVMILVSLVALSIVTLSFDQITKGEYLKLTTHPIVHKIDTPSFKILHPTLYDADGAFYAKDKNNVYNSRTKRDGFSSTITQATIIEGVDVETFEVLVYDFPGYELRWTMDKNFLYHNDEPVKEINRESYEILGNGYAKDKNNIYVGYATVLQKADMETFELLDDEFYAKDKNFVYLRGKSLPWIADPQSFEILDSRRGHFARDNVNIYYSKEYYPIDGADTESFVFIERPEDYALDYENVYIVAKDKYREYSTQVLDGNFRNAYSGGESDIAITSDNLKINGGIIDADVTIVGDSITYNKSGKTYLIKTFSIDPIKDPDYDYVNKRPKNATEDSFTNINIFSTQETLEKSNGVSNTPLSFSCTCDDESENGSKGLVNENLSTNYSIKILGAKIVFESEDGKTKIETTSNADGYDVSLPCGRYVVTATHPNYEVYSTKPGFVVRRECTHGISNIYMTKK